MDEIKTEIMSIDVNNVWNCENNWTFWTFNHLQGVFDVDVWRYNFEYNAKKGVKAC